MKTLYHAFFHRIPVKPIHGDQELHLLNAEEIKHVRGMHRRALLISASFSVLGFLTYYLPVYLLPGLFSKTQLRIPVIGTLQFPLIETIWGLLLMIIEIYALVLLNIYSVHQIAVATGYLNADNKRSRTRAMLDIGLEARNTAVEKYGINPYQGLSRSALFAYNLVMRLKGFLANKALQYLVRRLAGRLAIREVLDFIGMPVYMAINATSTHTVLREAQVVIMGRQVIELLMPRLPLNAVKTDEDRALVYDTLQYIAVSKRDYHANHYLLTKQIFERYGLTAEKAHEVPDDYLDKLCNAEHDLRALCVVLIILGFVLDGQISTRERFRIDELNERQIMDEDFDALRAHTKAFVSGAGIGALEARYLPR